MDWYVDGVKYSTKTSDVWYSNAAPGNDLAPFDQYFHFLLNIAVGGEWPGCTSPSCITASFPQEMAIDWVRVYQMASVIGDPHPLPGIVEAEDYDIGGEGIAYHDCDPANNGGAYRTAEGVDLEACSEGGFNVGWMCPGEWLRYTVDVPTPGNYPIEVRVASAASGGTFHIEFGRVDVTGPVQVPGTGGWQNWITVTTTAHLPAGQQEMRFVNSSAAGEYNINYFSFPQVCTTGDFDCDGDVDQIDATVIQGCLSGVNITLSQGCGNADFDKDGDVDQSDFGVFQRCLSGDNVPADPYCGGV
jgi:hypothetical protein